MRAVSRATSCMAWKRRTASQIHPARWGWGVCVVPLCVPACVLLRLLSMQKEQAVVQGAGRGESGMCAWPHLAAFSE